MRRIQAEEQIEEEAQLLLNTDMYDSPKIPALKLDKMDEPIKVMETKRVNSQSSESTQRAHPLASENQGMITIHTSGWVSKTPRN